MSDMKREHLPFHVSFAHHMSLDYIWSNAKELVKEHNVRCIFVEEFEDIVLAERIEGKTDDIGKICAELRLIARKLNIAIILSSNINSVESGEAPKTSDLSHYKLLKRHTAAIFLLYRPEYYGIVEDESCHDLRGIVKVRCISKYAYNEGVDMRMVKGTACYIDDTDNYATDYSI